jgi:hypothetical protein
VVLLKDYESVLMRLSNDYFIGDLLYVDSVKEWTQENNHDLGEPPFPLKLIVKSEDELVMVVQSEISDKMLSDIIENLSSRWSVRGNATNLDKKLNSSKKRLVYCFLKEYASSLQKFDGDGLSEDEWVFEEMEYLGYLK